MSNKVILVPTDFSENAKSALFTALQIAEKTGSGLVLLHAYRLQDAAAANSQSTLTIKRDRDLRAREQLNQLIETIPANVHVDLVLEVGFATNAIGEAIASFNPWLVVMGQRGNTSPRGLGTTASEALQIRGCPIMLVPENYQLADITDVFIDKHVKRNTSINELVDQVLIAPPHIVDRLPKDRLAVVFTSKRSTSPTRDLPTIFSDI